MSRSRPGGGTLTRLTIDRLDGHGDSVVSVVGEMAGEPLHFLDAGRTSSRRSAPFQSRCRTPSSHTWSIARAVGASRHSATQAPVSAPRAAPAADGVARTRARRAPTARGPAFTAPSDSATEARIEHENELARDVGHQRAGHAAAVDTAPFVARASAKVTSQFGSGRVFNGRVSSSHLGVDYRGALGDPIYAANRGVVALVDKFFLAGNVVYIDHGDGLVTGYFHMSQPEVAIGDTVERGQEIGLVGATGRVTGPHLHWSARFGALTIDPADLLSLGPPFVTAPPSAHGASNATASKRSAARVAKR